MQRSVRSAVSKVRRLFLAFCLLGGVPGATPAFADVIMDYSLSGTGEGFMYAIDGSSDTHLFAVPFSGSFTYRVQSDPGDPLGVETPVFDAFSVTIFSTTFDLTGEMNNPIITGGGPACIGGRTGPAAALLMLTVCGPQNPQVALWAASFDGPTGVVDFRLGYPWLRGIYGSRLSDTSVSAHKLLPEPNPDLAGFRSVYVGTWRATLVSTSLPGVVPEPSVLALAATAVAAGVLRARRRLAGTAVASGQPAG